MSTTATEPATTARERPKLPVVLLGLTEIVDLFPVAKQTVYRWRSTSGGRKVALPEPLLTVSGTPLWDEETVLEFAKGRGLKPDRAKLRKIRQTQRQA
jgi:hypothetical protein